MDEAHGEPTPRNEIARFHESRGDLLRALFDRADAGTGPRVFGDLELATIFAAAPVVRPGEPPAGGGIDAETIAALIEGQLDEGERARAIETLATDDRAFDQLLTVARFRLGRRSAARGTAPPGPVETAPRRLRTAAWWLLPIAAALALLVLWPLVARRASLLPSSGELVARADGPAAGFVPFELERPTLRGPAPVVEPTRKAALFELGVRTVDLAWLARRASSEDAMRTWVVRIAQLLEVVGLPSARFYESLVASAAPPAAFAATSRDLALAEAELASIVPREPPLYDLGRWSEAARLAARSQSRPFFDDPEVYRQPLERFRRAEPDPTVRRLLEALPDGRGEEALNFDAIGESLEAIQARCLAGAQCLGGHPPGD